MSKFYGSLKGSRGEVTRCGTLGSGITAHVRGWDAGIRVHVRISNDSTGKHEIVEALIEVTGGSSLPGSRSTLRLGKEDLEAMYRGEAILEIVPVIHDMYSSGSDPTDSEYERMVKIPYVVQGDG